MSLAAAPLVDYESFNVVFSQSGFDSWARLSALASPEYFSVFGEGGYRPLTTLVYFLVHAAAGAEPAGYRLVKLLLHAGCAAWVWSACRALLAERLWAALAAAAYLVAFAAPVFAGIAFVPDILAAFLCLAALRLHLRGGPPWPIAALGACACLAKETSVALPGVLLAAELLRPEGEPARARLRRHLPLWAATGGYLLFLRFWIHAEGFYGPLGRLPARPWWEPAARLLDYGSVFFHGPLGWALAVAAAGALLAAARGGASAAGAWRRPAFLAAWIVLPLAPALGLHPFPRFAAYLSFVEPRYLAFAGAAMACLPACLAVQAGAGGIWRAATALLLCAGIASQARAGLVWQAGWREELASNVERELRAEDSSPPFGSHLGEALLSLPLLKRKETGLFRRLERTLRGGSGEDGALLVAYFDDETLYTDRWKARQAMRLLRSNGLPELRRRLRAEEAFQAGLRALGEGRPGAARTAFDRASRLDAGHGPACLAAAEALARSGEAAAAERRAARCLTGRRPQTSGLASAGVLLDPERVARAESLGASAERALRARRYGEAEAALEQTLREFDFFWPQHWTARRELALLRAGARPVFEEAMDRFAAGDRASARAGFEEALRRSPGFSDALLSRAALRAEEGDWERAVADCGRALETAPTVELRAAAASARASAARTLLESRRARLRGRPRRRSLPRRLREGGERPQAP